MDFSVSSIAAGFVFGVFGMALIKRGKQQANLSTALIGTVLIMYPYFVENPFLMWAIGFSLLVVGYKL